jgi:hypothetical protein
LLDFNHGVFSIAVNPRGEIVPLLVTQPARSARWGE